MIAKGASHDAEGQNGGPHRHPLADRRRHETESGCEITWHNRGAKAERTLASARILVDAGDAEGACNRAYYAMLYAAHVALFEVGLGDTAMAVKTHGGLTSLSHREVIKTGHLPVEVGKMLDQVEQLRLSSDYFDGTSTSPDAAWPVDRAKMFLEAIKVRASRP